MTQGIVTRKRGGKKPQKSRSRKAASGRRKSTGTAKMYLDTVSAQNGTSKLVTDLPIDLICPAPENDSLYRLIDTSDPEFRAFAESIRVAVRVPLTITEDGYILSGHRRHAAAKFVGRTTVPTIQVPITRWGNYDEFVRLLADYNQQRVKTIAEQLREQVVLTNPEDAHQRLTEYRREKAAVGIEALEIIGKTERTELTDAKIPFFNAVVAVLNDRREYWPLSDRQIFYLLLNAPPPVHAGKPNSRFRNDPSCYHALTRLLTDARVLGRIPFHVIHDPTRPVVHYRGHDEPGSFLRSETDGFLRGYYRNLMQSQANHFELLGEKNTVQSVLDPIASDYTIPLTICRGYPSISPRHDIAQRFRKSGKDKLVLLIASDFDPEGEDIPHSIARSMRDDFKIDTVHAIKVALTAEQVQRFQLVPNAEAKVSSKRFKKFAAKYGKDVFELEAIDPAQLDKEVRAAVEGVIDRDAYTAEVKAEKRDAAHIATVREKMRVAMRAIEGGDDE
jgi:hypothetical protein